MSFIREAVASGIYQGTARALAGSVATALSGAGTTYADCTRVSAAINAFGTVAASTGAGLPLGCQAGDSVFIRNGGANALLVYPPVGGTLNGGTATTGTVSVTAAKSVVLVCVSDDGLTWVTLAGA